MATILDQFGRPVIQAALKQEQAGPTLRGVRRPFGMHQATGLTPAKLAGLLRESIEGDPERYLELAEDIEERNEHYAAVLGVRKRQVSGLEITVEAASDDAIDQEAAELVREVVGRDGFEDELFDILDAVGKGFSATEIIWETSERQWMPQALKWRDPRWFKFDELDGETLLLRGEGVDEPLKAFGWIVHRAKIKSGLTIRGGMARAAAWNYLFKSFTAKDWAVFCEAYGQPLRIGKWGPGATERDKQVLLDAVSSIGSDYAAIMPQSMAIEIVKAEIAGSHELYQKRADWLDQQVSKLVLGQTGTTDAIAGGHAVGKIHDQVRDDIEKADARQLGSSLNRDLVRPLVDLNFGPRPSYPKIRIGRPEELDVDKLVQHVTKLVPFGLRVGMSTMRDRIGLPDPEPDEELLVAPRASNAELPAPAPTSRPMPIAARAMPDGGGDAIDRAVGGFLEDEWEPLVAPIVAGLEEEIADATSIEEVRKIFQRRAETMNLQEFTEQLARLAFAARLAGEADEALD